MVDVGSAVGYLDLDISKFVANLNEANNKMNTTTKSMTDKLDSMDRKLSDAGKKLTATLTVPIKAAETFFITTAANFEAAMSKVSAISGASGKDLEKLTDKAREMGGTTKFSATESAQAFQYMAMAGWKTEDMLNGISGIMNLAAADGLDLATTSDIVTDALTAFGMSAEDSGHFADVLATAASNANTNVSMLGESFKYVAPIAGSFGYSAEDVATALGLMANSGIKGSQAGTALRSAISRLVKPTEQVADMMSALGINIANDDGSMKELSEVMVILREKFSSLTEEEQGQAAATLFGQEAMSGMLAIINASQTDYDKLSESINNADGKAQQMADTMNDNLNGQLTLLKSQVEGVAIDLGNLLLPALKSLVDRVSGLVSWFSNLSTEQQETILKIAGIVSAIGPALLIIGKLIGLVSTIIKVVKAAKAAMVAINAVMMANPILIVVAAVAALVAAFVHFYKTNEEFRDKVNAAWEKIKDTFKVVADKIQDIWRKLCEFFGPIFSKAIEVVKSALNTVISVFKSLVNFALPYIQLIGEKIQALWNFIVDTFSALIESLKPLIEEIFGAFQEAWEVIKLIWDMVVPYFEAIWEAIKTVFSVVADVLGAFFETAWEVIKKVWDVVYPYFQVLWEGIKAVFSVVKNVLGGFFKTAWTAIKAIWDVVVKYFTAIWAGIKAVFAVVKGVLSGDFSDAWEAIKNVWNKVVAFFQAIWDGIKAVFGSVIEWFGNVFSAAWDGIKSVWNAVGGFFQGVWDGITGIFSGVGDWFKEKFEAAFNAIKTAFSGIIDFFSGLWSDIKSKFTELGTAVGESVSGAFKSVVNGIIQTAEDIVNGAIDLINGAINIINKIPGVEIGDIDDVSFPRLAKGGIVDRPMIAQIGEQGREAIVPLENNLQWINKVADRISESLVIDISPLVVIMQKMLEASMVAKSVEPVPFESSKKSNTRDDKWNDENNGPTRGGDTYIFNSPKRIDEKEAAKQIKRVKKNLIEGF